MKTIGKILACLLTIAMLFTMAVPFTAGALTGHEGESVVYYTEDAGKTFTGTADDHSTDADIGTGAGSIKVTFDVKIDTPPVAGSTYTIAEFYQDNNNYIRFYLGAQSGTGYPQIGCDIYVNGTSQYPGLFYTLRSTGMNMYDGNWHTGYFEIIHGTSYSAVSVTENDINTTGNATADFDKDRGLTFTKLTVGGSTAVSNANFIGTLRNVKIENLDEDPSKQPEPDPDDRETLEEGFYDFNRQVLMAMDDGNSATYRIPAMAQAGNVTIVAADERKGGPSDAGAIDLIVRRSFDNGKTWEDAVTISEFGKPAGVSLSGQQPLHIDPSLTYDESSNTVYLFVDMFPESAAATNMNLIQDGSGFFTATVDGEQVLMQALNTVKNGGAGNVLYGLIQNEDGSATVYEKSGDSYVESKTYFVDDYSYGSLKKDPNGQGNFTQDAGNIFVYSTNTAGELTVNCTMNVWMYKSTDYGETWSNPVNITGQVKEDWMRFFAVAPGAGTVIKGGAYDGRIIIPMYYTNNSNNNVNSQSPAALYSDDDGETWQLGRTISEIRFPAGTSEDDAKNFNGGVQPTETAITQISADGTLRSYSRVSVSGSRIISAISTDGGESWHTPDGAYGDGTNFPASAYEPITQSQGAAPSTITYHDEKTDKYYVLFSNPHGPITSGQESRSNLSIYVREINYATGEYIGDWHEARVSDAGDSYSVMTILGNGNVGVFWENTRYSNRWYDMVFQSFSIDYLLSDMELYANETTTVTSTNAVNATVGTTVTFTLNTRTPVYVTGTPKLKINVGGTARRDYLSDVRDVTGGNEKWAEYVSGSGTTQLKFNYTIKANDVGYIAAFNEIYTDNGSTAENKYGVPYTTVAPRYSGFGNTGVSANGSYAADKSALADKIAEAQAVEDKSDALSKAIAAAQAVYDNASATAARIADAIDAIDSAAFYGDPADTEEITELIKEAQELYPEAEGEKRAELADAIANAATVKNTFGSTQTEVDEAAERLRKIIDSFKIMLGDVNRDGAITSLDATVVLQYAAGIVQESDERYEYGAADVSGDGAVTSLDATYILQHAAGLLPNGFPAQ